MHKLSSRKHAVGGNLCINLELGIAPLVDSARSGWIVRHMGAEFHDGKVVICDIDGPNDSSHGRKGSMMIKNVMYGSRVWQIMDD